MALFLAPIINDQQVDANGAPLSGGRIEVYLAGTSTPATTYSDKAGMVPNTNPIVLNTLGVNNQGEVWLTGGATYKFIIKNSVGVVQRTLDNISGIGDSVSGVDQWVVYQAAPTYVSANSFTVAGDQTQIFQVGRRIRTLNTGGLVYSTITASVYGAPNTTVTVQNTSGALDSGLSLVSYGIVSVLDTSLPVPYPPMRSLVVNGNFAVNQRVYGSGAATTTANQVTLDRWRVVVSGQNLTFGAAAPDRVVTCPAGGLEQIIEAGWVAGGVYVLSWEGTATGTVNGVAVSSGTQTGILPANTAVTLRLSGGTAGKVQFESTYATPYERRPPGLELALCQRDARKSYSAAVVLGAASLAGRYWFSGNISGSITGAVPLIPPMRIPPTIFLLYDQNGNVGSTLGVSSAGAITTRTATTGQINENAFEIVGAVTTDVAMTGQWFAATGF